MPFISVCELQEHRVEALRQIREAQTEYIITQQGLPIILLLPLVVFLSLRGNVRLGQADFASPHAIRPRRAGHEAQPGASWEY